MAMIVIELTVSWLELSLSQGRQVLRQLPLISQSHPIPDLQGLQHWWVFRTKVTPQNNKILPWLIGPSAWNLLDHLLQQSHCQDHQPQMFSIIILCSSIQSPKSSWCFSSERLLILKAMQYWSENAHMSFVRIELRGPMSSASWIEMSTQTCATPA